MWIYLVKDLEINHLGLGGPGSVLYEGEKTQERHRDGGRLWSYVSKRQGTLSSAGNHVKLGERCGMDFSLRPLAETQTTDTLILVVWPP